MRPSPLSSFLAALLALGLFGCGDGDGTAPEALLDAPQFVSLGQRAPLSAQRSTDAEDDIASYRFVIADGTNAHETPEPVIEHLFKLAGWIEVELEVIDAAGHVGRTGALVSVRRP
ncbi:MAG: PKD domain-containing protein [Myxococcales bacterium]|nr:PKD domain-containing protein [Myxococcales bacterium]